MNSEFKLTDRDFGRLRQLVKSRSGIDLGEGKRALVYGRLARRLRQLGLNTFGAYLQLVEDPEGDEATVFINALTTNVTEFFRENHHFELLARTILPALLDRRRSQRRIRIWSAGCATGEEPYSIAMVVREAASSLDGWDFKILATDLDSDALGFASAGLYSEDRVAKISPARRATFFDMQGVGTRRAYRAKEALRSLISFKPLNLMEPWPMQGRFDVIFCRNVVIYFDTETKMNLVQRYHRVLQPGGYLFLGHSESLVSTGLPFVARGKTAYQRPDGDTT